MRVLIAYDEGTHLITLGRWVPPNHGLLFTTSPLRTMKYTSFEALDLRTPTESGSPDIKGFRQAGMEANMCHLAKVEQPTTHQLRGKDCFLKLTESEAFGTSRMTESASYEPNSCAEPAFLRGRQRQLTGGVASLLARTLICDETARGLRKLSRLEVRHGFGMNEPHVTGNEADKTTSLQSA